MHHIICKTLLILSIIFAIIAISTPEWESDELGSTSISHNGLFTQCVKDSGCFKTSDKTLDQCQGLAIAGVVSLVLSLSCAFIPSDEFKYCKVLSMALLVIGVILLLACVILFASKEKKTHDNDFAKSNFGYSFYFAIASIVMAVSAGICGIIQHDNSGPNDLYEGPIEIGSPILP